MKMNPIDDNPFTGNSEFCTRPIGDKRYPSFQMSSQTGPWVRISSDSCEAQRMLGEVQDVPDVREQKVRELRALISSGTYRVSGARVAESMIKETMLGSIL